jgi:hypothetical protein
MIIKQTTIDFLRSEAGKFIANEFARRGITPNTPEAVLFIDHFATPILSFITKVEYDGIDAYMANFAEKLYMANSTLKTIL